MDNRKLIGRKLILHWGKLKVEISKLPYGNGQKDPVFDLVGSEVVLANVYSPKELRVERAVRAANQPESQPSLVVA